MTVATTRKLPRNRHEIGAAGMDATVLSAAKTCERNKFCFNNNRPHSTRRNEVSKCDLGQDEEDNLVMRRSVVSLETALCQVLERSKGVFEAALSPIETKAAQSAPPLLHQAGKRLIFYGIT
jgi:hypothetical protein